MVAARKNKLEDEVWQKLVRAVATEVAAVGLHDASINRILKGAGISKGKAYYYFQDKDDLIASAVVEKFQAVAGDFTFDPLTLHADNFWTELLEMTARYSNPEHWDPWLMTVIHACKSLPPDRLWGGAMGRIIQRVSDVVGAVIRRGQELGVVTQVLPADYLIHVTLAAGMESDRWMIQHPEHMDGELAMNAFAMFKRMLEPPTEGML